MNKQPEKSIQKRGKGGNMFGGNIGSIDQLVTEVVGDDVEVAVVETDKDMELLKKATCHATKLYLAGQVENVGDSSVSLYNAYKEFGEHFPAGCYFMWYKQTGVKDKNWIENGTNFFRGLVELAKTYTEIIDAETPASFVSGRFLEMKKEEKQVEFQKRVYDSLRILDFQTRRQDTMGDYSTQTSAFTGSLLGGQP